MDYSQTVVTVIQFNKDGYKQCAERGVNPGRLVANAALYNHWISSECDPVVRSSVVLSSSKRMSRVYFFL